jgi:Ca-activated chloride channel family protein
MHFAHPIYLALLVLLPCVLFVIRHRKALGHSQIDALDGINAVPLIGRIPGICRNLFMVLIVLALAQPQTTQKISHTVVQSRAFVITVDVSGSMASELKDPDQQKFAQEKAGGSNTSQTPVTTVARGSNVKPQKPTRAMAAREGVREFLLHRAHDLVALITFDDRCYYSEPLGTPAAVLKKLDDILYSGGGTNFDGPSASSTEPGAIACSIQQLVEMKAPDSRVLIMVTDGEDDIDPSRAEVLARAMHEEHVKMFVLGVGEDWKSDNKPDLQKFVERPEIGGQVIRVGDARQMREAFDRIDKLERSNTEIETLEKSQELYPYFARPALILLIIWLCIAAYLRDKA